MRSFLAILRPSRLLLFFFISFFILSCGEKVEFKTNKVALDFGALAISSGAGGVAVVDQKDGVYTTYVFSSVSSGETLNVEAGAHTFHAFAWSGPAQLEGTVYCGSQTVNLIDQTDVQNVSLTATVGGCTNYSTGSNSTYGINALEIASCNSLQGISAITDSCYFPSTQFGMANSYTIQITGSNGRNIVSSCFADNGGSSDTTKGDHVATSSIRIPSGGTLGVTPLTTITGYDRSDCSLENESAVEAEFSSSVEGTQDTTILYHGASTSRLFWAQNEYGQNSNILSDFVPSFGCFNSSGTPQACFPDYDLGISLNTDDYELYYTTTTSTPSFYSNTSDNSIHLTQGTPGSVGAPSYCTVSAYTGYTAAPSCACGASYGDESGSLQGCTLSFNHNSSIDKFTGHPSATPKTVSFTLINASPAPTRASYSYSIYASDTNFEGLSYAMGSTMDLLGTNYGEATYYETDGDVDYPYNNRGYMGELLMDVNESGIAGAMKYLGYTSCATTGLGASFSATIDGNLMTVTLTELSVSESSLPFPSETPIAFDRKYRMNMTYGSTTEQTTWLIKCAGSSGPPDQRQIGEIWSYKNLGATGSYVNHLSYNHSSTSKMAQFSYYGDLISAQRYIFSEIEKSNSSQFSIRSVSMETSSGYTSGKKVLGSKDNNSYCTQVFYTGDYDYTTPHLENSTIGNFEMGHSSATATAETASVNSATYASCSPTATYTNNATALLWVSATPNATAYANPYYVAARQYNSTCTGSGTSRSAMECFIYRRIGLSPSLVPLQQYAPLDKLLKREQVARERRALSKLKRMWAGDNGSCFELTSNE